MPASLRRTNQATVTSVNATTDTTTILAENADRLSALIFNTSNKDLYVKLGSGASKSSYSVRVPSDGLFEVPELYNGIITGLWDNGARRDAMITEIVL